MQRFEVQACRYKRGFFCPPLSRDENCRSSWNCAGFDRLCVRSPLLPGRIPIPPLHSSKVVTASPAEASLFEHSWQSQFCCEELLGRCNGFPPRHCWCVVVLRRIARKLASVEACDRVYFGWVSRSWCHELHSCKMGGTNIDVLL